MEQFPTQPNPEESDLSPERIEEIENKLAEIAQQQGIERPDEFDAWLAGSVPSDGEIDPDSPEYTFVEMLAEEAESSVEELIKYIKQRI